MDNTKNTQISEKEQLISQKYEEFKRLGKGTPTTATATAGKKGKVDAEPMKTSRASAAAIRTFLYFIENSKGTTVSHLIDELTTIKGVLGRITGKSKLGIISTTEQFIRFATLPLATMETEDMSKCKKRMTQEGEKYLQRVEGSLEKVTRLGSQLIFDGASVLVYSDSDVVIETLKAVPESIEFIVYATLNREPGSKPDQIKTLLKDSRNIEVNLISDLEMAYRMETIDLIVMGAESVLKNGGIINKIGSLGLAICAKEMNKPLYVLAESFKFSQVYPLNQSDYPDELRNDESGHARVDYVPSKYLTLLITDRGLLTSTAVCEELMDIYI